MEGDHVGPFNLGNPGEFTMLELAEVKKHYRLFFPLINIDTQCRTHTGDVAGGTGSNRSKCKD